MARISIQELRRMGVSQEDIDIARATQEAQRRIGAPVQSIAVIVGAVDPRSRGPIRASDQPISLTERALRRRGSYDQAALLLDQKALEERNPERALRARELAQGAKELGAAGQIEFDFFGGNVSLAFQYQDAVSERLRTSGQSLAKQHRALAVLWQIVRNLGWQSYECTKTAADLCEITQIKAPHMADTLKLLEDVGAICRVKRGRTKVITVTPEGAFRGNVNEHGKTVERYRLDVIEGGRGSDEDDPEG